jgi:hypothetical protein
MSSMAWSMAKVSSFSTIRYLEMEALTSVISPDDTIDAVQVSSCRRLCNMKANSVVQTFDGIPGRTGCIVTATRSGQLRWWPLPVSASPSERSTSNPTSASVKLLTDLLDEGRRKKRRKESD